MVAAAAGLVVLFLGAASSAHAADSATAPPAADPPPCRTVDFPTQFVAGFRGFEQDIPATISCVLDIHPTLGGYLLTFSNRVKRTEHDVDRWRHTVTASPRSDPSNRLALPEADFPGQGGCGLEVGDFNFDGFTDLALPRDFKKVALGAIANCRRSFLLFDPATSGFIENEALGALGDPWFDGVTREVGSYSDDGRAGALYTMGRYRFEGRHLVLYYRERRSWDEAARSIRATVEERRDGVLRMLSDQLVGQGSAGLYAPEAWELVDELDVDMGAALPGMKVVVLRSRPDPTQDEDDQPYLLDVLLVHGTQVLYRFARDELHPPEGVDDAEALRVEHGFLDARITSNDVTNDGVPEILFSTGECTGFDEVTLYHVIHCDGATRRCWDARHPNFITCRRDDFRWLRSKRGTVAVRATPVPDDTCEFRYCAAPFEFIAYTWDTGSQQFLATRSLKTKERLDKDGIQANRRYVDELLR